MSMAIHPLHFIEYRRWICVRAGSSAQFLPAIQIESLRERAAIVKTLEPQP
jgi:hypothetical protein